MVRKYVTRLSKLEEMELYVSQIRLDNGQLESSVASPNKVHTSTLIPGEEYTGKFMSIEEGQVSMCWLLLVFL